MHVLTFASSCVVVALEIFYVLWKFVRFCFVLIISLIFMFCVLFSPCVFVIVSSEFCLLCVILFYYSLNFIREVCASSWAYVTRNLSREEGGGVKYHRCAKDIIGQSTSALMILMGVFLWRKT